MQLVRYDAACRAIAEAVRIDEVKDIADKAEALRCYGRVAKNKALEVDAAEIRIRAERRIGELTAEVKALGGLHSGGRPKTGSDQEQVVTDQVTLADLGIDRKTSARGQRMAAMPDQQFEGMVADWRNRVSAENERVTTTLVRETEKADRREANRAPVDGGGTVDDLRVLAARGYRAGTIYADPPWAYQTWSDKGQDRGAVQHYDVMPLDDIMALPVADLAASDAALSLWCLGSMVPQALSVITAWGFEFKKIGFVWTKTDQSGSPHMGGGKWTRDGAEVCLFATRGAPKRLDAGIRQCLTAPVMEHSRKPDEFRHRVERLTSGPYLELFGRAPQPRWTVWSNQVRFVAPPIGT